MNLEDLKNNWKQEEIEDIPEVSLSEQKELNQPLVKIRKNLKMELWKTIFFIVMTMIFAFVEWKDELKLLFYFESLVVAMLIVCGYYFMKFKAFYSDIEKPNYSTFQSLLELNYRLKYFTDLYTSYYIAFVPFLFCELVLIYQFDTRFASVQNTSAYIIFVLSFFVGTLLLYAFGKLFFNAYYGKYIAKVANLLKEVEHPYENFEQDIIKANNKKYWYAKVDSFLERKFGILGRVITIIIGILVLLVVSYLLGLVIGYFGWSIGDIK